MAGWFGNLSLDNLGSQMSGLTQSLGEGATRLGQDIQQKVNDLASFDLQDIGKAIHDAENDISSEEAKVKEATAGLKQTEVKILPWETRYEEKAILSHGVMEKVLALSLEESNFTTAPPEVGTKDSSPERPGSRTGGKADTSRHDGEIQSASNFDIDRHTSVAIKMLSLDPNLAKVHSRLIAKMPEKTFWHYYFARVAAFRAEVGMEALCENLHQESSGVSSDEYDEINPGEVTGANSQSMRDESKTSSVREDADDDDFSDLGDLDELDADGDDDSDMDAALEAEIAAELEDG